MIPSPHAVRTVAQSAAAISGLPGRDQCPIQPLPAFVLDGASSRLVTEISMVENMQPAIVQRAHNLYDMKFVEHTLVRTCSSGRHHNILQYMDVAIPAGCTVNWVELDVGGTAIKCTKSLQTQGKALKDGTPIVRVDFRRDETPQRINKPGNRFLWLPICHAQFHSFRVRLYYSGQTPPGPLFYTFQNWTPHPRPTDEGYRIEDWTSQHSGHMMAVRAGVMVPRFTSQHRNSQDVFPQTGPDSAGDKSVTMKQTRPALQCMSGSTIRLDSVVFTNAARAHGRGRAGAFVRPRL
jgi:hypothetical protein